MLLPRLNHSLVDALLNYTHRRQSSCSQDCDPIYCRRGCGMGMAYHTSRKSHTVMVDFCNRVMGSLAVWSCGNRQFSGRSHAATLVTALRLSMLNFGVTAPCQLPNMATKLPNMPLS